MYKQEMADIQKVIQEEIELSFYETRQSDGVNQFKIDKIGGEPVADETVLLVVLDRYVKHGRLGGYALTQLDTSAVYGKVFVYYCKKKKGLFGKESLKSIKTVERMYHTKGLESGEEEKISLNAVMGK